MSKKWKSSFVKETHVLPCRKCNRMFKEVAKNVVAYECWICFTGNIPDPKPATKYVPSGHPRGWKWMKEYVDKDGNVYHKGVEQSQLKGTLPPTPRKPKKKKRKKSQIIAEKVAKYNQNKKRSRRSSRK